MTTATRCETTDQSAVLSWAAEKQVEIVLTQPSGGDWASYRSKCVKYDRVSHLLYITSPDPSNHLAEAGLSPTADIGLAFRRGHKKCLFVTRLAGDAPAGAPDAGTIAIEEPEEVRAIQRRAYQRVIVPSHRFVAVKLWEGGIPSRGELCYPLCSGRLANVSVGGVMLDIRADQNPRLQVGDLVGIEITRRPGAKPLLVEGHYRHCVMHNEERLGLGFQFIGLEHTVPGRSSLDEVAEFVSAVRRGV